MITPALDSNMEKFMKKTLTIVLIVLLLFIATNTAFAIRCGDNLISVGDLKNVVLVKCGEPFSKEIIGYIDHIEPEKRIRVMKIEE